MSKAPSAYELEKSVALWQSLQQAVVEDDNSFGLDESQIERLIREAGHRPPREMLAALIDAAILLDQKADHLENIRKRTVLKRDRYLARHETVRTTINQLMEVIGERAAEGELGSASFVKPRQHVVITDFKLLAERFIKRTDPEPRKQDIASAIRAGETVPGAELSTGNDAPTLRIVEF